MPTPINNRTVAWVALALVLGSILTCLFLPAITRATHEILWFDPAVPAWVALAVCALGAILGLINYHATPARLALWIGGIATVATLITTPRLGCPRTPDAVRITRIEFWGLSVVGTPADGYGIYLQHDRTDEVIRGAYGDLKALPAVDHVFIRSKNVTDEGVCLLAELPEVERVELISVSISRKGLEALSQMPRLRRLILRRVRFREEDLAVLSNSNSLELLDISDCAHGDAALEHVAKIKTLCVANFSDTGVSSDAKERLKLERPDLEIGYW